MATFGPIAVALVKEGCTAEQIAAAVAALEAAKEREREERLARLREAARLRQQRCRERRRTEAQASRMSRRDSALPPSPKRKIPTPLKKITPNLGGARARAGKPPAGRFRAERGRLGLRRGRGAERRGNPAGDRGSAALGGRGCRREGAAVRLARDLAAVHAPRRRRQAHLAAAFALAARGAIANLPRQARFAARRRLVGFRQGADRPNAAPRSQWRLALPKRMAADERGNTLRDRPALTRLNRLGLKLGWNKTVFKKLSIYQYHT
ncbi:protein of unknown function [Methylocella tundrae]|uniref:Uncharacterized protein n=1 Tax=Methylocella tundrae TaxID=227605 RepID=A0A4U8YY45_METTU|nr:protein of unknown function [Methylocella tundrae]